MLCLHGPGLGAHTQGVVVDATWRGLGHQDMNRADAWIMGRCLDFDRKQIRE